MEKGLLVISKMDRSFFLRRGGGQEVKEGLTKLRFWLRVSLSAF